MAIDSASNAPNMVVVHSFETEPEGEALESLLRENGIPVRIIRRSHDSVFDGLVLSAEARDRILVPEKDLDRARSLIEEYLQSIPKGTGDDAETLQWKSDLAAKRLRTNFVATWILCPGLVAFGLWVILEGSGAQEGKPLACIIIALAIVFFRSMRAQRRLDRKNRLQIQEGNRLRPAILTPSPPPLAV